MEVSGPTSSGSRPNTSAMTPRTRSSMLSALIQYPVRIDHVQPLRERRQALSRYPAPCRDIPVFVWSLEPQASVEVRDLHIAFAGHVLTNQLCRPPVARQ